jgi:hypothetical protein
VVQLASILDCHTLNTEQGATILLYKVFYKGKDNFISLGKCLFILVHGLRALILLKTKDRCKSLMVIGVTKIMCNTGDANFLNNIYSFRVYVYPSYRYDVAYNISF